MVIYRTLITVLLLYQCCNQQCTKTIEQNMFLPDSVWVHYENINLDFFPEFKYFSNIFTSRSCYYISLWTYISIYPWLCFISFILYIRHLFEAILTPRLYFLVAWGTQWDTAEITIGIDQWVFCYNMGVNDITLHLLYAAISSYFLTYRQMTLSYSW